MGEESLLHDITKSKGCTWDKWTCAHAALGGYLEVLQWAIESGCVYDREKLIEIAHQKIMNALIELLSNRWMSLA
jgi:hypothetical protein